MELPVRDKSAYKLLIVLLSPAVNRQIPLPY
nr:MAG TPA: hypothetical protein [Caudoviricetes sp.]